MQKLSRTIAGETSPKYDSFEEQARITTHLREKVRIMTHLRELVQTKTHLEGTSPNYEPLLEKQVQITTHLEGTRPNRRSN